MPDETQPPTGPVAIVSWTSTRTGPGREMRQRFASGAEAQHHARRCPPPPGWRYEPCEIEPPTATPYSLAQFLVDNGLTAVMLRTHVPDAAGTHCRECGGPQSGRHRWPCDTRLAAERACAIEDEQQF